MATINVVVLFVSALVNHFVGFFFYGAAFSNLWFEAMCDDKGGKRDWVQRSLEKRPMWIPLLMDFVLGIGQSFVLVQGLEHDGDLGLAVKTAFWLWTTLLHPQEGTEKKYAPVYSTSSFTVAMVRSAICCDVYQLGEAIVRYCSSGLCTVDALLICNIYGCTTHYK